MSTKTRKIIHHILLVCIKGDVCVLITVYNVTHKV